jgi:hypothetical protein
MKMANHKGSEGYVKVGASTIAETRDYSLTISSDTVEDSVIGDSARTYKPTLKSATGSFSVYWDEDDTSGQGACTAGSEVTLNIYPEGDTGGDTYYTMSAIITEESLSASFDGMVEGSYSFSVNGAVTSTTV